MPGVNPHTVLVYYISQMLSADSLFLFLVRILFLFQNIFCIRLLQPGYLINKKRKRCHLLWRGSYAQEINSVCYNINDYLLKNKEIEKVNFKGHSEFVHTYGNEYCTFKYNWFGTLSVGGGCLLSPMFMQWAVLLYTNCKSMSLLICSKITVCVHYDILQLIFNWQPCSYADLVVLDFFFYITDAVKWSILFTVPAY